MIRTYILTCLFLATCGTMAAAQSGDLHASLDFVTTTPSYGGCGDFAYLDAATCSELPSHEPIAGPAFAWIVLSNEQGWVNGIGGIQFGIEHTIPTPTWTLCTGGSEIPQDDVFGVWPETGTGNALALPGGCVDPATEVYTVGYFFLERADMGCLNLIGDPRTTSDPLYADCDATLFHLTSGHFDGIQDLATSVDEVWCGSFVCDFGSCEWTCGAVPTQSRTWGQIKSSFVR